MKVVWTGEPQFTYDYGEYGHYYTPIVRFDRDTYYGSKQHLGEKFKREDVTVWENILCCLGYKELEYVRYVREEHTWVFESRPEAIAFMARNGLHLEEAVRAVERAEAECP